MAITSSSTLYHHNNFEYDVFLSFRGEDTRKNFIGHLYYALKQKGIHTYKDDQKIKKGERISDVLIRAIEESKFYIIVFSKSYASSSWCLDELVKIMECQNTTEHTAYPVFYDVEPTEVRKQSGVVKEAFAKHEKDDAAGKWRKALKQAADLAGWELKNTADGDEAKFIQNIVEQLSLKLHSINFSVDENLVGMETRINDVLSSLRTGFDEVRMIGIKGIGGGGKTTLARAVFDRISFQFEGNSFVENVREVSNTDLKSLQNQVLSDVLNEQGIKVSSVSDGKNRMKRVMRGRKVVIVLDDVDHIDQLEVLANPNWFKPGSRIIITTRDEQVLVAHGVKLIHNVNLLSDKEALFLFSRYAFMREIPTNIYKELSIKVVSYASGLPLTIKVLGSFLCGKNESEWIDALDRLKTIPLMETMKKLELSYAALEDDYKEIFLDVACILKGWPKDLAIEALESCQFHARTGLKVLEQKSLIAIDNNERVVMHDHMAEMGRNIVRRLHPDKPNEHSRLWRNKEIEHIFANDLGTKATRCIRFQLRNPDIGLDLVMKGLIKMKELRFLLVHPGFWSYYDKVSQYFPNTIGYVHWSSYPFSYLPKTFEGNNLVTLRMATSNIVQLWEGGERKVLNKLRFLDLSHSKLRTLDLRLTPDLETLDLQGCSDLVELHMPTKCSKLRSFHLSDSKLTTLDLGLIPYLETLNLRGCGDFAKLHIPGSCPNLRCFHLSDSKLRSLDLRLAPNLQLLILHECCDLFELHMSNRCTSLISLEIKRSQLRTVDLGLTPNLKYLSLTNCFDLEELHLADKCQNLTFLDISNSKLRTFSIGPTPNIEYLNLKNCFNLEELHMVDECQNLTFLDISNSKVMTLSLGSTPNLEHLGLKNCFDLEELHMGNECQKLTSLDISRSKLRTLDIGLTPNLEKLDLENCFDLEELRMTGECQMLASLYISHSKLRILDVGLAPNLEKLHVGNCFDLEYIHMADECQKLVSLYISHSKLRTLDLGVTTNLEKLHLSECSNLVELRAPSGFLKKLVYLDLSGCPRFSSFFFCIKDDTLCGVDESLEVGPLAELHLTAVSLERCPFHPDNNLPKFQFTCWYEEDRPSLTRNLEWLISLGLCVCTNLERFSQSICALQRLRKLKLEGSIPEAPKDLDALECLEELSLLSTKIRQLPDSFCTLKHLKSLKLKFCSLLEKLPEDLGRLECLQKLSLSYTNIKRLPDSICKLKHLESIKVNHCSLLEKLPEDLGRLEGLKKLILVECKVLRDIPDRICKMKCLKVLNLEGTYISHLPQSVFWLKGLCIFGQRELLRSFGFINTEIQYLEEKMMWYVEI